MPVDSDAELRDLLALDTIAVVGCSSTPGKAAHDVPRFMQEQGYEVVPVNPYADEVLGREAYDSLADVEADVDIVDVFRPSEEVSGIVDEALERDDVEAAGRRYVEDRCLKVEYRRLA